LKYLACLIISSIHTNQSYYRFSILCKVDRGLGIIEEIKQDLENFYSVLQYSFLPGEEMIDRFEGILNSDFGANLRELRNQNIELT
jgi:hypothetical protein